MDAAPLWLTYAWKDNEGGDFSYLAAAIRRRGVDVTYDRIALIPGQRLWSQIGERIASKPLSGWAFLVTPNSLASQACLEELEYAVGRALSIKDGSFPLLGLMHGVAARDLPVSLRARLCIDLRSPDWEEQVVAAVERRPPRGADVAAGPYRLGLHRDFGGTQGQTALEIGPRFGEIHYWALAFPIDGPSPVAWGTGPAGGGGLSSILHDAAEGTAEIDGKSHHMLCGGTALSAARSAYLVFGGSMAPRRLYFGQMGAPLTPPKEWLPLGVG